MYRIYVPHLVVSFIFLLTQGLLKCMLETGECDSVRVCVCVCTRIHQSVCVCLDRCINMSSTYSAVASLCIPAWPSTQDNVKALSCLYTEVEECKVLLSIQKQVNHSRAEKQKWFESRRFTELVKHIEEWQLFFLNERGTTSILVRNIFWSKLISIIAFYIITALDYFSLFNIIKK